MKISGPWPQPHLDALRKYSADGLSGSQISTRINLDFGTSYSRCGVLGKLHRMGLKAKIKKAKTAQRRYPKSRQKPARDDRTAFKPVSGPPPCVPMETRPAQDDGIEPLRISIVELETGMCKWPVTGWPMDDGPILFCGLKAGLRLACRPGEEPQNVYCDSHLGLATKAPEPRQARRPFWRPA
jgi:hypothetical protein